jgi:hypothetical protein
MVRKAVSGIFSCDIPLHAGKNLIAVRATDFAGNVALASVHVTYPVYPAPTSITITPVNVNLVVSQTQQFTAFDNYGYPRPDATWSLPSRTTLATITSDSSPVLTANAVGQVVLTATVQGISAQTTPRPSLHLPWARLGPGYTTTGQHGPVVGKTTSDTDGNTYIEYVVADWKAAGYLYPATDGALSGRRQLFCAPGADFPLQGSRDRIHMLAGQ